MTNQSDISQDLVRIRQIASRFYLGYAWAFVFVLFGVSSLSGNTPWIVTSIGVAGAAIVTYFYRRDAIGASTRYVVSAVLTGFWALLVYSATGLPDGFVLDAHMMFFVLNALLVAYFC